MHTPKSLAQPPDPTVSRLVKTLATDAPNAIAAIATACAAAPRNAQSAAGGAAPDHAIDEQLPPIIDLDAALVTAHSEKEYAAPNFIRGFGFHPLDGGHAARIGSVPRKAPG